MSRKGDIEAFLERLPDLIGHAGAVMTRVEALLADDNIRAVDDSLRNVREASAELPTLMRNAAALAADLRTTAAEATALTQRLNAVAAGSQTGLEGTLKSTQVASEKLARTAESLERIVAGNEAALSGLAGPGAVELQQLVLDVRDASAEVMRAFFQAGGRLIDSSPMYGSAQDVIGYGLAKLGRSMTDFRDSHLEEDVIQKKEKTLKKVRALSEVNPMLGHRGVRLGITYPEIYSMQIQAVLEAAALCAKEGIEAYPEIMVPQVATVEELARIHSYVKRIHKVVELTHGINVGYKFGSMLEVVRACLRAGRMAQDAEFFSFGTNDLTQATFSFSREDAENKFLPNYVEAGILIDNPFEVLDQKGVGELMKLAVAEGRKTNPELKVGICGEHGGHPASIRFCDSIGLDYVSCSAPRVPIARLAAAHAAIAGAMGLDKAA